MIRKSKQVILPFKYYEQIPENIGKDTETINNLKYQMLNGLTHFSNNSRNILPEVMIYLKELQPLVNKMIDNFNIEYKRRPNEYDIGNIWSKIFKLYPLVKHRGVITQSDGQSIDQYINVDIHRVQVLKITTKFPVDGDRNLTVLFKYENMYFRHDMLFKDIPNGIEEGDQVILFGNWYITHKGNLAFSCLGIAKCDKVSANSPISEYLGVYNVKSRNFLKFPKLQAFNETDILKADSLQSQIYNILYKRPFYASIMDYNNLFIEYPNLAKIEHADLYDITLFDFIGDTNANISI